MQTITFTTNAQSVWFINISGSEIHQDELIEMWNTQNFHHIEPLV